MTRAEGIKLIEELVTKFERHPNITLGSELLEEMADRASTARDARVDPEELEERD